jgi:hypothetical protein
MHCLFCNKLEKNYRLNKDIEFVCSECVNLLADADREGLKRAYQKAQNEGFMRKLSAIESFLLEETINDRKAKNSQRNMVRKRPLRTTRLAYNQDRT